MAMCRLGGSSSAMDNKLQGKILKDSQNTFKIFLEVFKKFQKVH
jgi:hypothetical protein